MLPASERPFRRFPRPPFSRLIVLRAEKPYLLFIPNLLSPALAARSSRLHYLRTPYVMPLKQPALTLSRLMRLVSSLVFGAVGVEVARIDIRKANRKRQRAGDLEGKYFEVFWQPSSTYERLSPVASWINKVLDLMYLLYLLWKGNVKVAIAFCKRRFRIAKVSRDSSPCFELIDNIHQSVYTLYIFLARGWMARR